MSPNKEELKNKITYRASYRGTKEMDILLTAFVNSFINELNISQLQDLNTLINLGDEELLSIKKNKTTKFKLDPHIIKKFIDYKL